MVMTPGVHSKPQVYGSTAAKPLPTWSPLWLPVRLLLVLTAPARPPAAENVTAPASVAPPLAQYGLATA